MNTSPFIILVILSTFSLSSLHAQQGKKIIGKLKTTLYLAGNSFDSPPFAEAKKVSKQTIMRMKKVEGFDFQKYYLLGEDKTDIFRSFENWALPLKPSKVLTLSYEPIGKPTKNSLKMNLDLWQKDRKIMKTAASKLELNKTMYIRGPQWKKGFLIIAVEVLQLN